MNIFKMEEIYLSSNSISKDVIMGTYFCYQIDKYYNNIF